MIGMPHFTSAPPPSLTSVALVKSIGQSGSFCFFANFPSLKSYKRTKSLCISSVCFLFEWNFLGGHCCSYLVVVFFKIGIHCCPSEQENLKQKLLENI